jgi:hypothetical protein
MRRAWPLLVLTVTMPAVAAAEAEAPAEPLALTNWDARRVAELVRPGTRVVFQP